MMKKKKRQWYKKKRFWFLGLLVLFFFVSKMEWAKMRYNPQVLSQWLIEQGQMSPVFKTKKKLGRELHYLQIGNRSSLPLIVFVHGSPGALNAYEEYFSDTILSKYSDMIAVDRLGFGYSDFGKSVSSLLIQAELIASILEDFPRRKKILVGHSMGGPVIARLVMDHPELVDGLVMVAPSISPSLEPSNAWRKVIDFPPIRWLTPSALRVCNQEIIPLRRELDAMMDGWADISVPITVVQGTEDVLVPKANADFAKAMITDDLCIKTTMVEKGDHFILWTEMALIKKEILELLSNIT